jgi:hypothetical protein
MFVGLMGLTNPHRLDHFLFGFDKTKIPSDISIEINQLLDDPLSDAGVAVTIFDAGRTPPLVVEEFTIELMFDAVDAIVLFAIDDVGSVFTISVVVLSVQRIIIAFGLFILPALFMLHTVSALLQKRLLT